MVSSSEQRDSVTSGFAEATQPDRHDVPHRDAWGPAQTAFGRYIVLEEVGSGAMGRVFRAYDPKLQREVALKEVWPRLMDDEAVARLVGEARAMAKLSHPNVVDVYDVEIPDEPAQGSKRLLLVMEFIPGHTLEAWLGQERRSWAEVVERFIEAGRGLAASHRAGLLHRDFKPSNVLLGRDGSTKVTDFGLAKGAADAPASRTNDFHPAPSDEGLTQDGLVIGTPRYMAPEQHHAQELTPAVDQYAFCVSLWQALTGEAPFRGEDLVSLKWEGPPEWPETRVPRRIVDAIRRGLHPEPAQRWGSIEELLDVLQRNPVNLRGRRVALAATCAVLLGGAIWWAGARDSSSLCAGGEEHLAGVWDDDVRSRVETSMLAIDRSYASDAWQGAAAALDQYADAWLAMRRDACEASTIRREQSPEVMDLRMACLDRAKTRLAAATSLLADADEGVVQRAHRVTHLPALSQCADVAALQADYLPPLPEDAQTVRKIRALLDEANIAMVAGRVELMKSKAAEAETLLETVDYAPLVVDVHLSRAFVAEAQGEYDASERALREVLRLAPRHERWFEMRKATNLMILVLGHWGQRQRDALHYGNIALALTKEPWELAATHNNIGMVLYAVGDYAAAEAEHRLALEYLGDARSVDDIGMGDPAMIHNNLARDLHELDRLEEAQREYETARDMYEESLGPDHPKLAMMFNNLGLMALAREEPAKAESLLRRALDVWIHAFGEQHPYVPGARSNLAMALEQLERYDEAEAEYRRALDARIKDVGPEHQEVARITVLLATMYATQGRLDKAEEYGRRALEILDNTLEPGHPRLGRVRYNLALIVRQAGKLGDARELLDEAWKIQQPGVVSPGERANTAGVLAELVLPRDRERAGRLARSALAGFRESEEDVSAELERLTTWMDENGISVTAQ